MVDDSSIPWVYPLCVLEFIIAVIAWIVPAEHASNNEPHIQKCHKTVRTIFNYLLTHVCLFYAVVTLGFQFDIFYLTSIDMAFLWAAAIAIVLSFIAVWKEDLAWSTVIVMVPTAAISHLYPSMSAANLIVFVAVFLLDQAIRWLLHEIWVRFIAYTYSSAVIAMSLVISYAYLNHRADGWVLSQDVFKTDSVVAAIVLAVTKLIWNILFHFCYFKPRALARKNEMRQFKKKKTKRKPKKNADVEEDEEEGCPLQPTNSDEPSLKEMVECNHV